MQTLPIDELQNRWDRCRRYLQQFIPEAEGFLLFSRLNIYYMSGTFGNGIFWLPLEGEPVLLVRRGVDRARIESPIKNIYSFQTYKEIEAIFTSSGSPLRKIIAAEKNGLSWALSNSLIKYLHHKEFLPGDRIIGLTRALKSPYELQCLRQAGEKHAYCLTELLPPLLHENISELDIGHIISDLYCKEGHHGILRMENYGEEVFQGHISMGDSGIYPSVFNGPVGLRGIHPSAPHVGSKDKIWKKGEPLIIDNGFTIEGYQTDKTHVFWLGNKNSIPAEILSAHKFCVDMQQWISSQLKPGILPSEIWQDCYTKANNSSWRDGFMALANNKVNFVGHGIGLAVDEYPVLAKGFDLPLEEGMVIAVEPKIGIPKVGMVGIENTFEVTFHGGKCLTESDYGIICIE